MSAITCISLSFPYSRASRATVTAAKADRPPCATCPNDWDLDVGTPESWRAAVEVCGSCPLRSKCEQLASTLITRGDAPKAMIWAGVAYDNSGRVIENLDRYRVTPLDHRRPMRIIRTGTSAQPAESVPEAPRRHLVLGRPLRPTGTGGA
ncbi:hypothetical protein [Nocardia sp. NBC_01388]|uniref:hypothetical protein n=1 Tax=Nocardia sp. NBC_01388 TaxID=2903596 RepID=UPI00324C8DC9